MLEPTEPTSTQPDEKKAPAPGPQPRTARSGLPDFKTFVTQNARLLLIVALLVFGVVFIVLGWYGTAHTNIITEQIPYLISGGLLGLGLIIVSGILASSAMQERSNDALRKEVARALASAAPYAPDRGAPVSANGKNVFIVDGGRSYHEAGCPLIEGKERAKELVPARAAEEGYAPCKLCAPD